MDAMLFADMSICINESNYRIRPTIGALCSIEAQTGLPTLSMISLLYGAHLPATALRIIINEGMNATENPTGILEYSDESLKNVSMGLCSFLLTGVGCDMTSRSLDSVTFNTLKQPDWQDMFKTYVGMMARSTEEFWQLTIHEYMLAMEGFCTLQGIETIHAAFPATSGELAELMQRFPDARGDATDSSQQTSS